VPVFRGESYDRSQPLPSRAVPKSHSPNVRRVRKAGLGDDCGRRPA
jgi:hypothetical protein